MKNNPMVLRDYQLKAISKMKTGCILCGGVGSGKSITSLAYYHKSQGGCIDPFEPMDDLNGLMDLYIITTAQKRDTLEWEGELSHIMMSTQPELNLYTNKVVIDSWNNIKKYVDIRGAFFIFDEDHVTGNGAWVKAFLKIAKANEWIILSATPGDKYEDYIPVFVANGFYRNITEFKREHLVYSRFSKYPKVERYLSEAKMDRLIDSILIPMHYKKPAQSHHVDIYTDYNVWEYKELVKTRWNKEKQQPIETASEFCYELRKLVNIHPTRLAQTIKLAREKQRVIIFYSFDYELEELKNLDYGDDFVIAEWNGHKHEPIPESNKWVYLVNYSAGAEGWNCIKTDTIIFYSQSYSYKVMIQAAGRIDRMNTPYTDLYFYHFKSRSGIDLAISKALKNKKEFNVRAFANIGKEQTYGGTTQKVVSVHRC